MDKLLFDKDSAGAEKLVETCPYCEGKDVIKKGERLRKYENAQVYY